MTAPRHLWSGDWELESSAHADDLAARRGRSPVADETEPAQNEPPARPPRESFIRRTIRRLREGIHGLRRPNRRHVRLALLTTFLILLGATAAYAVISDSSTTKRTQTVVASSGGHPWLGVKLANAPVRGALVSAVVPNSPAAQAGIRPGDLITQLDTQPIVAPAVFVSAIDGLQPGNAVDIQLQRGASQYTAHVTLAGSPSKTP
jgi:membrane-associated protease RseP (regulator of RpoE activity)